MAEGKITVGLIIDSAASEAQAAAVGAIASGAAGGPMAALGPLVGAWRAWSGARSPSRPRA
jgi:hypothetical protein